MNNLYYDLRYGWRQLLRNPGFTLISVLCLAVGIGACTAIFSIADALLLRPTPIDESRRILIGQRNADWAPDEFTDANAPWAYHWAKNAQTLEEAMPRRGYSINFNAGDRPLETQGAFVPAGYFRFMGLPVALGAEFSKEHEVEGQDQVVILSHGFWQEQFAGQTDVIGQEVLVNAEPHTVLGVLTPDADRVLQADLVVPLGIERMLQQWPPRDHWFMIEARMKEGVTREQVEEELNMLAETLIEEREHSYAPWAHVTTRAELVAGRVGPMVWLLASAVGLVLLIGCANAGSLMLSRGVSRRHELAVRVALGAGRGRLLVQLLTENLLLSLIAGVLGVLIAAWGIDLLLWLLYDDSGRNYILSTMLDEVALNNWALGFCFGVTLLTGLLSGFVPALALSGIDIGQSMKEAGSRSTERGGQRWLRSSLVTAEVALAFVLIVGAVSSAQSFLRLSSVDLGIQHESVYSARIRIPLDVYQQPKDRMLFTDQLLEQLQAIPGVEAVALNKYFVFGGGGNETRYRVDPADDRPNEEWPYAAYLQVSPDYFKVMSTPIVAGRTFGQEDRGHRRVLVNRTMAEAEWPNQDAIGQTLFALGQQYEIIGVVGDTRMAHDATARTTFYLPHTQGWFDQVNIVARTNREVADMTRAVEDALREVDPTLPVADVDTLRNRVNGALSMPRASAFLMNTLSVIALVLAVIGLYGVMSYHVNQGRKDIAIRMALGARTRWIMQNVLGRGLTLTGLGLLIGVVAAFILLSQFADRFGVIDPVSPAVLLGVLLGQTAMAVLACFVPAWRATRIQPMELLRDE